MSPRNSSWQSKSLTEISEDTHRRRSKILTRNERSSEARRHRRYTTLKLKQTLGWIRPEPDTRITGRRPICGHRRIQRKMRRKNSKRLKSRAASQKRNRLQVLRTAEKKSRTHPCLSAPSEWNSSRSNPFRVGQMLLERLTASADRIQVASQALASFVEFHL